MNAKDNEDADYSDLSVSESEFNDEEQRQFAKYLKERRQAKEEKFNEGKKPPRDEDAKYDSKIEDEDNEFNAEEQLEELQTKIDKMKDPTERFEEAANYEKYV